MTVFITTDLILDKTKGNFCFKNKSFMYLVFCKKFSTLVKNLKSDGDLVHEYLSNKFDRYRAICIKIIDMGSLDGDFWFINTPFLDLKIRKKSSCERNNTLLFVIFVAINCTQMVNYRLHDLYDIRSQKFRALQLPAPDLKKQAICK